MVAATENNETGLTDSQKETYRRKQRLLTLLQKKRALLDEFKVDFVRPNDGGQNDFFSNGDKLRRFIIAGNRFGKSFCGVLEDLSWCLGERRFYPEGDPRRRLGIPSRGVKGLVIVQTWDKVEELFTSEGVGGSPKGKLIDMCPARYIVNRWKDNMGRTTKIAFRYILDGQVRESILHFATVQSYLRNEMVLESSDWDFIHVDEPIPRDMWIACSRGLVDRRGSAWFLLTPLCEMWIYDDAVKFSMEQPDKYFFYQGSALENKHVKGLEEFYSTLSEEELACRRDGKPMAMGRLVIHAYNEKRHLLKGVPKGWKNEKEPPKECMVAVAIDTHPQTPHAVLVCAVSLTDVIFFDERFERGSIKGIADWLKSKPYFDQIMYTLIEPAAFITDQSSGMSYADEFEANGILLEKGSKARTECIKLTNERFFDKTRPMYIHESLKQTRKEIMSWYFGKDNKPNDSNDHLMECMGRLVMHDNLNYHEPPWIGQRAAEKILRSKANSNDSFGTVGSLDAGFNFKNIIDSI